jgi:hypothetical protein
MPEQQPKRSVSELKPAELRIIVGDIQKLLWWDLTGAGESWCNQKHFSLDMLDHVARVLQDHGLAPIDRPTVIGFKCDAEFTRRMAENFSPPDPPDDDAEGIEE